MKGCLLFNYWSREEKIQLAKKAFKVTAGMSIGIAESSVAFSRNTLGLFYKEKSFQKLLAKIREQSVEYDEIQKIMHQAASKGEKRRTLLLDSLGLATGSLLSKVFGWHIPEDIKQAYELAYPVKASQMDFQEAVHNMDDDQLTGFINGIKGKLFEMRYTDYLNDGHLPTGYHAELAQSATQPGWDIAILNDEGQINDTLQLKATESVDYIEHAFERYPYIDIVSTDEVYSQVTMGDMADHVIDSGISDEELTHYVQEVVAANDAGYESFLPSLIPYAIIGYSVARNKKLSEYKKGKEFGRRSLLSYVCHTLGIAAGAATGFWWLVPVTSIGLRVAQHKGAKKYERYQAVKRYAKSNERVLKRYRKIVENYV